MGRCFLPLLMVCGSLSFVLWYLLYNASVRESPSALVTSTAPNRAFPDRYHSSAPTHTAVQQKQIIGSDGDHRSTTGRRGGRTEEVNRLHVLWQAKTRTNAATTQCHHPLHCKYVCEVLHKLILKRRANAPWKQYYADVANFLSSKRLPTEVVVEIGTAYGGMANQLLTSLRAIELHVVDPFLGNYDPGDATSRQYDRLLRKFSLGPIEFSRAYAQAMAYDLGTLQHGCRYRLHHAKSTEAALDFPQGKIGAIFIDGLHTEAGVTADVAAWSGKIAPWRVRVIQ